MPNPDELRANLATTLSDHFPGAEPTQIGLAVIALREDVLHYADEVIAERTPTTPPPATD